MYTLNQERLREIVEEIIELLIKKNQDYDGASFDLGMGGNVVHLWDKVKRYRALVDKKIIQGGEPNFETIVDTLHDIVGYALIGLLILDEDASIQKST